MKGMLVFVVGLAVGIAIVLALRLGSGVVADVTYVDVTLSEMVQTAPLIVVGTVLDVSGTRWNQDDGTFWEKTIVDKYGEQTVDSAVPYHRVELQVERTLVDRVGLEGDRLSLTVVGMGHDLGGAHSVGDGESEGVISLASDTVSAEQGDRVIAFVQPGQLAWRDGRMLPVFVPMGAPGAAVMSEASIAAGAHPEIASFDGLLSEVGAIHRLDQTND